MSPYLKKLNEAQTFLAEKFKAPQFAVVLGSGLGGVVDALTDRECEIPFSEIPHLAKSNVEGHKARLVVGKLGGVRVVCVQGRLHFYEGHSMEQVVFLVRTLARQGVETFVLTNAAGGLRDTLKPLDLLLVNDHLNLFPNVLLGPNEPELGPRFPDLSEVYDAELRAVMKQAAAVVKVELKEGVYAGMTGPTYETPAEVRLYRSWGADVVGMSTVPEAIALRHMGKKVVGLSCVTNLCAGVGTGETSHGDVLKGAAQVGNKIASLLVEALPRMGKA